MLNEGAFDVELGTAMVPTGVRGSAGVGQINFAPLFVTSTPPLLSKISFQIL